jgi:adenosylmethionine-8-amino-7-oxononanoate aminotransferase
MIALDKGYHGSSSNGAGLTGLPAFHRQFDVPHRWQHHIPAPIPIAARWATIRKR